MRTNHAADTEYAALFKMKSQRCCAELHIVAFRNAPFLYGIAAPADFDELVFERSSI